MQKTISKNQNGTSLIEIMLAISIFIILGALTLDIFKSTVESQKSVIAGQNTQENLRYLFEIMSKEMRSAVSDDTAVCDFSPGGTESLLIYNTSETMANGGDELYFKNKDNECVSYYIGSLAPNIGRLMIDRDGTTLPITPNDITVTDLGFIVDDNVVSAPLGSKIQPRVTLKIEVEANNAGAHSQSTVMQTTVSSRHYE